MPIEQGAPIVRFAPSPTGKLHIGNARAALLNYLFAKAAGGQFVLRLDDTDRERSTDEFAQGIIEDLNWLGLASDRLERQSERLALYDEAATRLKEQGRLYPCYETADELDRRRKRQRARGLPPIYDRAALQMTKQEKAAFEAEGRRPHWRFKLAGGETRFEDMILGSVGVDTGSVSDPVLIREDGTYLYTLPSVIDDIEFGITHVIRGNDHVTNTGVQIQLIEALGGAVPAFAHYSLLQGPDGRPFSKRADAAFTLSNMRDAGYEPMAVASLLARLGTPDPVELATDLATLAGRFDLTRFGKSDIRLDAGELDRANAGVLGLLTYEEVRPRLVAAEADLGAAFWVAVQPNLATFGEVGDWARVVQGPVTPVFAEAADKDFAAEAGNLLPAEPWDDTIWGSWTGAVKQATGRKGKMLFMPLRLALTGLDHGPELKNLLPLIGRDKALARLQGQTA